MRRIVLAVAAGVLLLQVAVRLGVHPHAEAWVLYGIDADGAALWTTLTTADTGLLDGQLTTRLLLLPAGPGQIEHRAQWGPTPIDAQGVHGMDRFETIEDGWELRIGGEGLGARVTLRGAAPGCPPALGEMGGVVEDRVDGRLISGRGVVVREALDGHPVGTALYALDPALSLAVDPWSACPAWVRGTTTWTGAAVPIPAERRATFSLGDWTITLRGVGDPVLHEEWAHALLPERAAAAIFGFAEPTNEARRVVLDVHGPDGDHVVPGIRVERR